MLGNDKRHEGDPMEGLSVNGLGSTGFLSGHLPCHLADHLSVLRSFLQGAEGEGQESDAQGSQEGQESAGEGDEGEGDGEEEGKGEGDDAGSQETFSREYVEKLRQENAKHRKEAKEYKSKVSEFEKAQMSELDKAKVERDEEKARAEELEKALQKERVSNAVLAAAMGKNFHDPSEAVQLIDMDSVKIDDDGNPDKKSVSALVNSLATSKPHLLKTTDAGSGDGGAHGSGATQNERVAAMQKEFDNKGMIKAPA